MNVDALDLADISHMERTGGRFGWNHIRWTWTVFKRRRYFDGLSCCCPCNMCLYLSMGIIFFPLCRDAEHTFFKWGRCWQGPPERRVRVFTLEKQWNGRENGKEVIVHWTSVVCERNFMKFVQIFTVYANCSNSNDHPRLGMSRCV